MLNDIFISRGKIRDDQRNSCLLQQELKKWKPHDTIIIMVAARVGPSMYNRM